MLSNEQAAALVAAAREGQVGPRGPEVPQRRGRRVRTIDFSRPAKLTQEQQRRFERAHEPFCRAAAVRLSAQLRTPIEFDVINGDQLTWSSALAGIPGPSVFAVIEVSPMGTTLLLSAELDLVMRLVERLLGGNSDGRPSGREPTEIELALARRLLGVLVEQLSLTWQELVGVQLQLTDIELQASNVQLAQPSEPTVALTIEVRLAGGSSTLSLVVPYRTLEPVMDRLPGAHRSTAGELGRGPENERSLRSTIATVEVELRAEIGAIEMTIDEVLAVGPGTVVRFGVPASAGALLCAGDTPIRRVQPGLNGGRRAVEVVGSLEDSP
jgi:flagellar motor switch protein FliM